MSCSTGVVPGDGLQYRYLYRRIGGHRATPRYSNRETDMKRLVTVILALSFTVFADHAYADAAFQFAVPGLRVPDNPRVSGVRLSILHGRNQEQHGLDLGLLSLSETGNLSGLALSFGIGRVTGEMSGGAAFSFVNWHSGRDSGMNGAFVNVVGNTEHAFNLGFINVAQGGTAADLGGFNMSNSSRVQIGFINVTERLEHFSSAF